MKTRHLRQHHPDQPTEEENGGARKRAKTACERCRRMKVRCRCMEQQESDQDHAPIDLTPSSMATSFLYPDNQLPPDQLFQNDALQSFDELHSDMDLFAGLDTVDTVDWTFGSLLDLDFLPFDNFYNSNFYPANFYPASSALPENVVAGLGIVERYHQSRSGAVTPTPACDATSPQKWFSEPPRPQIYDDEVISIFVGLATDHIGSTFKLFATHSGGDEAQILAMAAVGGLYCQTPDSFKVARALYHDARRLVHASISHNVHRPYTTHMDHISLCKTSILLEIYGYASGDKRSYEFIEAFHTDVLQLVSRAVKEESLFLQADTKADLTSILESLHILECYRAVILQRPPTIPSYLTQLIYNLEADTTREAAASTMAEHLFTVGQPGSAASPARSSLTTLSVLAGSVAYVVPRTSGDSYSPEIYRSDFTELALDKWLRSQPMVSPPEMILFRMIGISLHTNLETMQFYALARSNAQSGHEVKEIGNDICEWYTSHHYAIAKWNAAQILLQLQNFPYERLDEQKALGFDLGEPLGGPHIAYSVYYAVLVLWCGSVLAEETSITQTLHLRTGVSILSRLKVRIAKVLCHALEEISN